VEWKKFDFRKPVRIGARIQSSHPQMLIARGLDHDFVLSRTERTEPALAVPIIAPASGRQMDVRTTG
jgi:aldose 1-epimerase